MMTVLRDRTGQFLRNLPLFTGLSEDDIQTLLKAGAQHAYKKNQHLFYHGDKAEKFFIVVNGCIKLYSETEDGEEHIIDLLTAGDNVGEACIFDGAIYPFSASAAENSEIYEIRADLLKQTAKNSPNLTAKIMAIMSDEMHDLQIEKEHLANMSASQRLGCTLLRLSAGMVGKGGTFTLPYDKSLAAANLGMKPETFSRALKDLQSVGVTAKGSEITIENFEKLAEHSCAHCSAIRVTCGGDKRASYEVEEKTKRIG
jgi:CRP-like cAMP-binding protein